jgi:hypothetical protein
MFGGSTHRVTGGYYHLMYDSNPAEYDVAIIEVGTDCDIPTDSAKQVMCLWRFYSFILFIVLFNVAFPKSIKL